MTDLDSMTLRQLQLESARVISTMPATNDNIHPFNKESRHDSTGWYKAAIKWYVEKYGDLPSRAGPGSTVEFVYGAEE